ncbi:MAG: hypothetical protein HY754_13275 [Nitrospirae bacterium]|nr:hypothetical protein [Nitrospirota bacterium]
MREAEEFRSRGIAVGMNATDYVSVAERQERVAKLSGDLEQILKTNLPKTRNLDIVILKCHLIIEFMFNQYIDLIAPTEGIIENERFTFKQKQTLVHLLGFPADPLFMPSIDILNTLRNQVAHTLSIDRKMIDKLIRLNAEDPKEANHLTDSQRATWLKHITKILCWMMLGAIEAKHETEWTDETVESGKGR